MFFRNWNKDLFTIPNLLSLFRLTLIPVYMTIYLEGKHILAGSVLALSCLTDLLDGWIARKFDMCTRLGKFLDPLADKATQLSLAVCLSLRYSIMGPVLILLAAKETFQLWAGLFFLRRGKILSHVLVMGKVCTAVLFVTLTALVLLPNLSPAALNLLAFIDLAVLSLTFFGYVQAYFGTNRYLQNIE